MLGLLTAIAVAGLLNLFDERPTITNAAGAGAELTVFAPDRLRGGLFYQGRLSVHALERIDDAVLLLDPGWAEQMHINTIEPAPVDEAGQESRLALGHGPLDAGDELVVYLQFQVNPTNVGRRSQRVELRDGATLVAAADRTVMVFPLMDVVLRAIFGFAFFVLLFRVIGRRELSSLEPFDLNLLVVIGDLIQQGVTQSDYSITGILLSVGTFAILTVLLSFLTARVPWLRPVFEARPIIVLQDGEVIEGNFAASG